MMKRLVAVVIGLTACGSDGAMAVTPDAAVTPPDAVQIAPLPDLRFKSVGAFPAYTIGGVQSVGGGVTIDNVGPSMFSGLELGGGWELTTFAPARPSSSAHSTVISGALAGAPAAIAALPPSTVITSIDYLTGNSTYAMTAEAPASGTPYGTSITQVSAESELAGYVSTRAAQGVVITALGFDGTAINVFAYGIISDTTAYETQVLQATFATVSAQAAALAAGGYIITAFGRTSATNFTLVGTRVPGATTARQLVTDSPDITSRYADGYVLVGMYYKEVADPQTQQFIFPIFER